MMSSTARVKIIREAINNFVSGPHGVCVLRSEILKATLGSDLDGRGICDAFVPVGANNQNHSTGLSGLETIATLMESDPSLNSAFVFSKFEIAGVSGFQVLSALKEVIPSTVSMNDVLSNEYFVQKLSKDLGL
ncbi:hypothetical protein ACFFQ5_19105 [Pseudomonas brassicacearum]|jgi:hypothetical protein|uniref:hypothetical protein n=1 Tax=Pseudomonas TaxID=286 RepID=UPI000519B86A|nr:MULTISPECIES: hypothetical protein [Pseudomonas]KAB0524590.1 hypothetical protein F7R20_17855 [Pseudomonas brassicacearum subsp. brassicacearum]NJP62913.1 hypothetical protein [Pseudomonas brassicacearum]PJH87648.1 hypothetical protein CVG87_17835 [Pseudomonas sp. WCS365]QEO79449.1 hypothetical protein ELZ14_18480 [Pseudomonas brassicacearum]ROM85451.1 hypothetical protein BK655_10255 [Pseudomonas brassicacearum]